MSVTTPEAPRSELRVRLAAVTASGPGARRFVRDGLAGWGRSGLVDDAALCVTEMAANAALHSYSQFMDVIVHDLAGPVRVAVQDEGRRIPLEAVTPTAEGPDVEHTRPLDDEPMTGRGLAIVSMLAESWGVDDTPRGRRIWADLADTETEHMVHPPIVRRDGADRPRQAGLPGDWKTVLMPGCPVQLALRIDQHLDDLVRELQLIGADEGAPPPPELAELNEVLATGPIWARHTGRRIAQEAAAAGLEHVDIEMTMPRAMSAAVRELQRVGEAGDELCRTHGLLTTASTPQMHALRSWITESACGQLDHDAEPVSYADWLRSADLPE
jgi:anti-sigma regulatory factor (Ser/Thr protein kinase)